MLFICWSYDLVLCYTSYTIFGPIPAKYPLGYAATIWVIFGYSATIGKTCGYSITIGEKKVLKILQFCNKFTIKPIIFGS